jgi:hypothetical protein
MWWRKNSRSLIVLGELGQLNYYREVAARLQRANLEVGFCCDRDDPGVADAIRAVAESLGAPFFHHGGDREAGVLDPRHRRLVNRRLRAYDFRKSRHAALPRPTLKVFLEYHAYRIQEARRVLQEFRPRSVVTGEDGIAANVWMIRAARCRFFTKVITLPYGLGESSCLVWKGIKEKHAAGELITTDTPEGAYVKKHYPHWVKQTEYGECMYLPPLYIVALEELGIRLRDPWCLQGGQSQAILIANETMRRRYLAEGVPDRSICMTGSIYTDVLFDSFAADPQAGRAFAAGSPIDAGRRRVLVCVPPSESSKWGDGAQFSSLSDYVGRIRDLLSDAQVDVVWSLHPRILPADKAAILALGIVPSDEFVVSLIPRCDILIACNSSVPRWAFAARKVVVNYDLYQFGVNDFPEVPAYRYTCDFAEFTDILHDLIQSPDAYRRLVRSSQEASLDMGEVDGRSALRIAAYLTGRRAA